MLKDDGSAVLLAVFGLWLPLVDQKCNWLLICGLSWTVLISAI